MKDSLWNLSGVTLAGRIRPRLDNVSLEIPAGVTAVMGNSGAGKSSLIGLLTDFERPDVGTVRFQAPDSSGRLPLFWSPQDHGLWPHLSVHQHIESVRPSIPLAERSVSEWLDLFGLQFLKDSLPGQLSQGERSRLAIARALASEASVLVLDEPMVHVDPLQAHRCWQIVDEHIQRHRTEVVYSTHDPDTVLKYAQHVICLRNGAVSFSGAVETLYFDPPAREPGWLLGPCNWFGRAKSDGILPLDAATCLVDGSDKVVVSGDQFCLRPTELKLEQNREGRFKVESITPAATVTEVLLRDLQADLMVSVFVSQPAEAILVDDLVQLVACPSSRRKKSGMGH